MKTRLIETLVEWLYDLLKGTLILACGLNI